MAWRYPACENSERGTARARLEADARASFGGIRDTLSVLYVQGFDGLTLAQKPLRVFDPVMHACRRQFYRAAEDTKLQRFLLYEVESEPKC